MLEIRRLEAERRQKLLAERKRVKNEKSVEIGKSDVTSTLQHDVSLSSNVDEKNLKCQRLLG